MERRRAEKGGKRRKEEEGMRRRRVKGRLTRGLRRGKTRVDFAKANLSDQCRVSRVS